jgi:dTMP kinase
MKRGLFITLEGIDGTGKSTQLRLLAQHLKKRGLAVRVTREPGGTEVGERIRKILLASTTSRLAPLAELALLYAARAQHLQEVIGPALAKGQIVLSDRYNDASLAYQGFGRELGVDIVRAFDRIVCARTQPDLTIVLDLAPRLALLRAQARLSRRKSKQARFELQGMNFHKRVRNGYLAIARKQPRRVKVVPADGPVAEVQAQIRKLVDALLARRRGRTGNREWGIGNREQGIGNRKQGTGNREHGIGNSE